jgi:hypothetical protein
MEVCDRHGANIIFHGHAHHGSPDGKTTAGIPVHNVAMQINLAKFGDRPYRIFDV